MRYKIYICKDCGEEFGLSEKDEAYLKRKGKDIKFTLCKTCYRKSKGHYSDEQRV